MKPRSDIGDRHSRPVRALGDGAGLAVRIVAGLQTRQADQQLLACLVNLLCRMEGSVSSIELDLPDGATSSMALPNGAAPGPAFERFRDLANWATDGAVPIMRPAGNAAKRYTVCIGTVSSHAAADIYVHGLGWNAWVSRDTSVDALESDDGNPIGPWFAACLAAGEVFKQARGLRAGKGRHAGKDGYSLWSGDSGLLESLGQGPSLDGISLPPFYLVGAGAVGQGLLALLGAARVGTFVVTIDDDSHDTSNLNRCFIAGQGDVTHPKVEAVERFRRSSGLAGSEFPGTLQQFATGMSSITMPEPMRQKYLEDRYEIVVSAVDKNTSRWDVQGLRPRLIIGGSTDQLTARAMTYGEREGEPCLACYNPKEPKGAVRGYLEREIRSLGDDQAKVMLAAKGLDEAECDAALAFLRNELPCGSLGDQALGFLEAEAGREFSVSFVSMAAAILAFVRLLRATAFLDRAVDRPMMSTFAFGNLVFADGTLARDLDCTRSGHLGFELTDGFSA